MEIERHPLMDATNVRPIVSHVVAHGDRVYVCAITKLLTAQVWLSDMALFRTHNLAWNEWVDPATPPARACVQAELTAPGLLVEIMVTAAR